ncbi:hypothetical protein XPA_005773 [Xanthoria parietina]
MSGWGTGSNSPLRPLCSTFDVGDFLPCCQELRCSIRQQLQAAERGIVLLLSGLTTSDIPQESVRTLCVLDRACPRLQPTVTSSACDGVATAASAATLSSIKKQTIQI